MNKQDGRLRRQMQEQTRKGEENVYRDEDEGTQDCPRVTNMGGYEDERQKRQEMGEKFITGGRLIFFYFVREKREKAVRKRFMIGITVFGKNNIRWEGRKKGGIRLEAEEKRSESKIERDKLSGRE